MKKNLTLLLVLTLILAFALSGCSAGKSTNDAADISNSEEAPQEPTVEMAEPEDDTSMRSTSYEEALCLKNPSEKIIYSGSATVETLEFDDTLLKLSKMIKDCNGYVQSSNIFNGEYLKDYYGRDDYRTADYCIRIPVDDFSGFQNALETLGNVPYSSTNADNITMQYRDTEARLNSCKTEETRLLELLAKANTVEDMLKIEGYLSDVRYEIESLTSQMENWDRLVSYSTLNLSIKEVIDYTQKKPATVGYGQQLKEGFLQSLSNVGDFFKNLFKWVVVHLPVLILVAVVAFVVVVIICKIAKRARKRGE